MNTRKENESLYHNAHQPLSLGCTDCPDKILCGGLQAADGLFDCMNFCVCQDPSRCQYVCERDPKRFIKRSQEVRGYSLSNIPRTIPFLYPSLPLVVPLLYHSYGRKVQLNADAVGVQLSHLFDHRTGQARFTSKEEISDYFRFNAKAQLVIVGVDKDQPIENYWSQARAACFIEQLSQIKPDLVTVPNYSLFLNVPRWDNLHSMKRIAICWNELVSNKIPASLHLNARTDQDWQRWIDFIAEREEVQSVTIEYATGAAILDRGRWHTEKLLLLAQTVRRNLQLVLRGGYKYFDDLSKAFKDIVFINTTSFMKTIQRRRLAWYPGAIPKWHPVKTPKPYTLDTLLQHNVDRVSQIIAQRFPSRN